MKGEKSCTYGVVRASREGNQPHPMSRRGPISTLHAPHCTAPHHWIRGLHRTQHPAKWLPLPRSVPGTCQGTFCNLREGWEVGPCLLPSLPEPLRKEILPYPRTTVAALLWSHSPWVLRTHLPRATGKKPSTAGLKQPRGTHLSWRFGCSSAGFPGSTDGKDLSTTENRPHPPQDRKLTDSWA